jgi:hypothetical protein
MSLTGSAGGSELGNATDALQVHGIARTAPHKHLLEQPMTVTPSSYLANTAYPPSHSPGLIGAESSRTKPDCSCNATTVTVLV